MITHWQKELSYECARVATDSNRSYSRFHNDHLTEIVMWFSVSLYEPNQLL